MCARPCAWYADGPPATTRRYLNCEDVVLLRWESVKPGDDPTACDKVPDVVYTGSARGYSLPPKAFPVKATVSEQELLDCAYHNLR